MPVISKDRVEGLTIFRVVVVTSFLLFTLIFDVESISNLTEARSTTLLILIVASYLLSIAYSLLIRQMSDVSLLGIIEVTLDMIIAAVFIGISGGLSSLFIFLFHVNIVAATSILGRKVGLGIATMTAVILGGMALGEAGLLEQFFPNIKLASSEPDLWFRTSMMASAGYMLAFLSGYLADSLGRVKYQLEEHKRSALEQQALNEYILDGISSGVATIDENDEIIFFNNAAVQITGMSKEFALGLSINRAFPEIGKILSELDVAEWEKLSARRFEAAYKTSSQDLHLGFSISPLEIGKDKEGLIIIFQNLTDVRQLELMMRRNQHLAAVGEMAASIAHEIRNPLAAISGSVEMLEEESSVSDESKTLHGIVLREVERLNLLVTDFLNYSSPRPLEIQTFNLEVLFKDSVTLMENKRGDVDIDIVGLEEGQLLTADPEVLKQILWNLVNNAADAMGGRGKIRIGVEDKEDVLSICVEDEGPGIKAEDRERVFEPFFTSKTHGTGLGLATTFRLIEAHGGAIVVSNAKNLSGARFEFNLGKR